MTLTEQPPTADELAEAYRRGRLRYCGITLYRALNDPLFYKSLMLHVDAMRKKMTTQRQTCAGPAGIESGRKNEQ